MDVATSNRLFAIAAEMRQLENEKQERRRVLNLFLRSLRATIDPARKEARIRNTIDHIEGLNTRLQALRAEQEELIVRAVTRGHRGD